eukprot:1137841-Pelagomonas_calceolata.AAC.7
MLLCSMSVCPSKPAAASSEQAFIVEACTFCMQRNAHRNKIDYMSTIRPDVETMNQTMRPLGTYATDVPHAQKTGTHIPQMTLGPKDMYWHPDVRLSEQSWAIATQVEDFLLQESAA